MKKKEAPKDVEYAPIHRKAPSFEEQATQTEMLETGIKVVDLLCPYQKGGKIGLFGGAGVGKDRSYPGTDYQYCNGAWRLFCIHWCRRTYP